MLMLLLLLLEGKAEEGQGGGAEGGREGRSEGGVEAVLGESVQHFKGEGEEGGLLLVDERRQGKSRVFLPPSLPP